MNVEGALEIRLADNVFYNFGDGIQVLDSRDVRITGNSFFNGDNGIFMEGNEVLHILSNYFDGIDNSLVTSETSSDPDFPSRISGNTFVNSYSAIEFYDDDHTNLEIACNDFLNYSAYGIYGDNTDLADQGSPQVGAGNRFVSGSSFSNNLIELGGNSITYYYDPSLSNDFKKSGVIDAQVLAAASDRNCSAYKSQSLEGTERSIASRFSYKIWPNPNNGNFELKISDMETDEAVVSIYNAIGELVLEQYLTSPTANLSLMDQPAGLYLISITQNGISKTSKLIIE